jgi:hypothetical protein
VSSLAQYRIYHSLLFRLWELLLSKLAEKGMRLQQALVLVQYLRQVDEVGVFPQLRKLKIKDVLKETAKLEQSYFHTA